LGFKIFSLADSDFPSIFWPDSVFTNISELFEALSNTDSSSYKKAGRSPYSPQYAFMAAWYSKKWIEALATNVACLWGDIVQKSNRQWLIQGVHKSWCQPDAEDRGISCHSNRKYSDITLVFFKWYQTKSFGFRDKEEIM
jgi:hypothetical protein